MKTTSGAIVDTGQTPLPDRSTPISDDEIDLLNLLRGLWRGKWWVLLAALAGLGWGLYRATIAAVPMYTAHAVVALETRDENVVDIASAVTGLPGTLGTINTELGVMRSRGLIGKLVRELDLASDPEFNPQAQPASGAAPDAGAPEDRALTDLLIDRLLDRLSIHHEPESFLFTIAATSRDPEKSALIANTHARLYIEDQIEVKYQATEQATAWLTQRLGALQEELEAAESAVEAFASENRIIRPEDLEILNQRIDDTRGRLAEARDREAQLAGLKAALEAAAAAEDWAAAEAAAGDAGLSQVLEGGTETELARRVQTALSRIEVMRARARSQAETLEGSIEVLRGEYTTQSGNLVAYQQLEREVTASRAIYEYFLTRLKELSAQQGNLRADSRIISEAAVPLWPSSPVVSRIVALSVFAGLMIGAAGVLGRELLRTGLRSAQDIEKLTGYPVIGQIPLVPRQKAPEVLSYFVEKPASMASEAVRNLRTSILASNLDSPPKVIMLTSSVPGEGKTITSITLAQNFTGLGKRVLLIEGDIRRRVFRDYLELSKTGGLLSVLSGEATLAEAVARDYLTDADLLVGERTAMNAADVFSSGRFRALIAEARADYDIVIIDTPPVLVVPDARIVGRFADAVVYVVEWNATPRRDVIAGLRMLSDGGVRAAGVALTRINLKKLERFGEYAGYGSYAARKKYAGAYHDE